MSEETNTLTIGIPIYLGFDMLDVAGPYEVFSWMQNMWRGHTTNVLVIGHTLDPVLSSHSLAITPTATFDDPDLRLDVLFVPGAPVVVNFPDGRTGGLNAALADPDYKAFLEKQGQDAKYVCSVCTGAILLAKAGLLDGFKATTHWSALELLAQSPKVKVVNGYPRYVVDRNRVTGGGISSGLDEALKIVWLITHSQDGSIAEQIQLAIQYSPDPPFNSGNPYTASYDVYEATIAGL